MACLKFSIYLFINFYLLFLHPFGESNVTVSMTEHSNRMRLIQRDSSCDLVQKVPSSSSKKKNNASCQREYNLCGSKRESFRSKIEKMGPMCKTRKKSSAVFLRSEENDFDLDKQFGREICIYQDQCMWLSSDSSSPSSFFNKCSLSGLHDLSLDDWFVTWLSISGGSYLFLGRELTFFDGSSINPIEESSLALERSTPDAERILQEDLKEEEVVTWLLSSTGNDAMDSEPSEGLTSCENSPTPIINSPAPKWDVERLGLLVSLVNLDDEDDSKWISDTESELESFQSDFPSPSFKSSCGSEVRSSISSTTSQLDLSSDVGDLEELDSDDPIFWPFERKVDWNSWDSFSMSPRKDIYKLKTLVGTSSIEMRLDDKKNDQKKVCTCKRRLEFSAAAAVSKIMERKRSSRRRINPVPSRLNKSTKIVPLDEPTDQVVSEVGWDFLEQDFGKQQVPIESLLGLDEFNGSEGIDSNLNEDVFFLDESL